MAPQHEDDLAPLARAARAGDRNALEELLRRVVRPMAAAVRGFVPPSEVDDVLQEALWGFARSLGEFRFESSVRHFACRVAVRTASMRHRAESRRRAAHGRAELEAGVTGETMQAPQSSDRVLRGLLARLSEPQAQTVALRFIMGCSLEEVAELTGVPVNTVRSRLRLAKEALQRQLAEESVDVAALGDWE